MKLIDRKQATSGDVKVFIGRRPYIDRHGQAQVCRTWHAECAYMGERYSVPLNTKDETTAIHRAHELADRILKGQGISPAKTTIVEMARRYMEFLTNRGRAKTTLTKYEYTLATFIAWANEHFNRDVRKFTEDDFWRWYNSVITAGFEKKTAYDRSIIIKQLFKWATTKGKLLTANPVSGASLSKPPPNEQPCFSPDQVAGLLEKANDWLRPIVAIMAYAGLRFGEVRDLHWSALHLPSDREGTLTVRLGGSNGITKNKKVRRIPLHPELRKLLDALPRIDERVVHAPVSIRNKDGTKPLNESYTLKEFKKLCRACGFANPDQYKLHTLRHAFASMLARNQVSYQYALSLMGHHDSGMLQLYYHQFDDTAAQAIQSIQYSKITKSAMTAA